MSSISASQSTVELFRALADETRLGILKLLRDGEHCVGDLTEALETGQSRLSFHLKILRQSGLVTARREGRWIYYALSPEGLHAAREAVSVLQPTPSILRVIRRCE